MLSNSFELSASSRAKHTSYVSYNYTQVTGTMPEVSMASPQRMMPAYIHNDFFDEGNNSMTKAEKQAAFEAYEAQYFD